jgi:hypothetical protein
MTDTAALVRAFEIQSGACAAFGSPFSGALLAHAAKDIAEGGRSWVWWRPGPRTRPAPW